MNEVVEKRLEFLKLEAKGFYLCELVKLLNEKIPNIRETTTITLKPATPANLS